MNKKLFTEKIIQELSSNEDLLIFTDFNSDLDLDDLLTEKIGSRSEFGIYFIDPESGLYVSFSNIGNLDDSDLSISSKYITYEDIATLSLLSNGALYNSSENFIDDISTRISVNVKEDTIMIIDFQDSNDSLCQETAQQLYLEMIKTPEGSFTPNSFSKSEAPVEKVSNSSKIFLF